MMNSLLTVITPASSYDLTVLDTVKLELGVGVEDNSQDDKLAGWIHQASDAIASRCKRVFAEETISEMFRSGYRRDPLILERIPINSITSIVEDDITLLDTEYEIDYRSGMIYRLEGTDGLYRNGWYYSTKVTVIYTAGYVLLDDLPYDVEKACILLIKHFKNQDITGGQGGSSNLRAVEIPGVIRREWDNRSNNYQSTNSSPSLPPDVMALLGPYIRNVIG